MCPLELVKLLVRAQEPLHRLDVLLLLEPRERVKVIDGLGEHPDFRRAQLSATAPEHRQHFLPLWSIQPDAG